MRDHSAREIREYFIADFSDWKKHDEYQKASFGFAPFGYAQGRQEKFWAVDGGFEGGGEGRRQDGDLKVAATLTSKSTGLKTGHYN